LFRFQGSGTFQLSICSQHGYITGTPEAAFWILTALAGGRQHGYAILREVEQLTGAAVSLRVTTLYATLERLERDGRVRRAGEETVDGRERRYYELTDGGRQALALEADRLAVRLRAAESRLAALRAAPGRPAPATMSWGFAG
jgi:PadR family transcriptional regulator PadR